MFKKLVKAIAAIQNENDRDECYWPWRTTSSSSGWLVWLRLLNFFSFVCTF